MPLAVYVTIYTVRHEILSILGVDCQVHRFTDGLGQLIGKLLEMAVRSEPGIDGPYKAH